MRSTQEVFLLQQAGRPRSSSTTDTPSSPALADMLISSGYHSTEESDRVSQHTVRHTDTSCAALSQAPHSLVWGTLSLCVCGCVCERVYVYVCVCVCVCGGG